MNFLRFTVPVSGLTVVKKPSKNEAHIMKRFLIGIVALFIFTFLISCSESQDFGDPAENSVSITKLSEILQDPDNFHQKTVVLRGVVSSQCANLCNFIYSENAQSVTIFLGDFEHPRIPTGTPVRVTARVHSGENRVVLTADGLNLLEKGGKR